MYIFQNKIGKLKIAVWIIAVFMFIAQLLPLKLLLIEFNPGTVSAAEIPEVIYYGDAGADAVLGNMSYSDLTGRPVWSSEAIYETGALGIIKGFDSLYLRFGRTVPLVREEALSIVYRAAGREAEAQQLGISLNNTRTAANKKTDPLAVLYDGFIQLAANEGLITAQNYADAMNADQSSLDAGSFQRKGAAQRQEMAVWLAKALGIQPAVQQQELLNYADWRSTDPDKLPYLEAILQQDIMNGSGGRINPKQPVTREQGAQIVKNAESCVLEALKYVKKFGVVENITETKDYTGDIAVYGRNIEVRNTMDSVVTIRTSAPAASPSGTKNENAGTFSTVQKKELIIYKNGAVGNSSLLKTGDRIQYIIDTGNTVKYIQVVSNVNDVRYIAAQVNSVDDTNSLLNVTQLFELDYPDLNRISGEVDFSAAESGKTSYRVAGEAEISVNGALTTLSNVTDDATAILTIDSNNLIQEIQCIDLGINSAERQIVRGIVEENNPDLGYLTLYNEDGTGTGNGSAAMLRTYNYTDPNKMDIYRNHKAAKTDSIQMGDMAYIRLDNDGNIVSVSSVDNYSFKYGRVVSKLTSDILVEYEDGMQQLLAAGDKTIVIRDKQLVGLKALKDGDRVRLLLNENGKSTDLKEITIEGDEHYISNIYKGTITKIDDKSDKISVMGMQAFAKGNWERTEYKGFTTIPIAEGFVIYADDQQIELEDANRLFYSNEAYIAVEKTYGGTEEAVLLSFRNSLDTQVPTASDSITGVAAGSGSFLLSRENQRVSYSPGSIVVKYGRLVSGNSLSEKDRAYLALNRDYESGRYYASVIKVDEPQTDNGLVIYRGRISAINDEKDVTLESFSLLQGSDWVFSNTPKTFNITFDTRVLDHDGIVNVRDFKGYGEDSYLKRTVYIVADGTNAVLVSTAPYGTINIKGTVYGISGTEFNLRNVRLYNPATYMWTISTDAKLNILKNSIIIRNGEVVGASDLKNGDAVRILKRDATVTGDSYIVFVE